MDSISLYTLLLLNSFIQTSEGLSTSSSSATSILTVSPNRSQFFAYYEPISFYCETPQGDSTGWTVMRNANGKTEKCSDWGKPDGSSCKLSAALKSESGVYWCESEPRNSSNTVNITVTDGAVILESPVFPVMEGSEVTLRCWMRPKLSKPPLNLPADFYKDGSLISNTSTENMTIHSVHKSDAGFYKCVISGHGESPESWMDVRESQISVQTTNQEIPPDDQSGDDHPSSAGPTRSIPLHCVIRAAVCLPILFVLVLVSVFYNRKYKGLKKKNEIQQGSPGRRLSE